MTLAAVPEMPIREAPETALIVYTVLMSPSPRASSCGGCVHRPRGASDPRCRDPARRRPVRPDGGLARQRRPRRLPARAEPAGARGLRAVRPDLRADRLRLVLRRPALPGRARLPARSHRRKVWQIFAAIAVIDFVAIGLSSWIGILEFFGDPPMDVAGYPLWWAGIDGLDVVLGGAIVFVLLPHLQGRAQAWLVLVPSIALGAAAGIVAWPVSTAINSSWSMPAKYACAFASIALSLACVRFLASALPRLAARAAAGSRGRHRPQSRPPSVPSPCRFFRLTATHPPRTADVRVHGGPDAAARRLERDGGGRDPRRRATGAAQPRPAAGRRLRGRHHLRAQRADLRRAREPHLRADAACRLQRLRPRDPVDDPGRLHPVGRADAVRAVPADGGGRSRGACTGSPPG